MHIRKQGKSISKKKRQIDSVSFYAALSRMVGSKSIKHTQGYEMLRQMSYQMQEEAADGNQIDIKKIFE